MRSARCSALASFNQHIDPGARLAMEVTNLTKLKWPVSCDRSIFCFSCAAQLGQLLDLIWEMLVHIPPSEPGAAPELESDTEEAGVLLDIMNTKSLICNLIYASAKSGAEKERGID